jgi:hypothetical protein
MGFNWAFKGLKIDSLLSVLTETVSYHPMTANVLTLKAHDKKSSLALNQSTFHNLNKISERTLKKELCA